VDAFEEEVAEEGNRHGGLPASGWEVLELCRRLSWASFWRTSVRIMNT